MLTGFLVRRWCKSPKAFVYDKFAERKPGLDKGQGLLTLHDSTPPYYPLCTTEGIKAPFKNKVTGLAHRSLAFPCHSFADAVHPEGTFRSCWGWTPTKMDYKLICRDFKVNDHISVTEVVQFSLVAHSCLTLCNPMDYSKPGFPFCHQLLEST